MIKGRPKDQKHDAIKAACMFPSFTPYSQYKQTETSKWIFFYINKVSLSQQYYIILVVYTRQIWLYIYAMAYEKKILSYA